MAQEVAPRELIVWIPYRQRGLEAAYERFELEHPGWKVTQSAAGGPDGMDPQKLLTGIAGGHPPDLVYQDRFAVGEWAARDAFLALDDWIARSLTQQTLAETVETALTDGDAAAAGIALTELIDGLEPMGPSRRLSIAKELATRIERAPNPFGADTLELSRELTSASQGIDPESFYPACWLEAEYGQGDARRAYAIPNRTDVRALYYNTDLLERAGLVDGSGRAKPPGDWDELREYAIRLTEYDEDGRMTRLGFAPNYGNSWLYLYGWLNGGRFMSEDGQTCTLNDPRIVEALAYMVDVYDDLGGIEVVDTFQSSFQPGSAYDPFLTGKVAMKIDGDNFISIIANHEPTLPFDVALPPAPAGMESVTWSGGFSWAIPRGAPHAEMAFELIRFLNSESTWRLRYEVESRYAASRGRNYLPPLAPSAAINRMADEKLGSGNPDLPWRMREMLPRVAEMMEVSRFRPVTPVGQLLWDEQVRAYENAVRHRLTPAEALERGRERVQRQLDRAEIDAHRPILPAGLPFWITAGLLLAAGGVLFWVNRRQWDKGLAARREARAAYVFASPWLIGLTVLIAGPVVASAVLSFCQYDVLHPARFVGLDNYIQLFTNDPLFWYSLANTGFMLLSVPIGMAVGLAIALMLNAEVRGMRVYRTLFYMPTLVPVVASSLLWLWVLNPELGLINSFLRMFGWADPPKWLASASWFTGSKSAIVLMMLWGAGGSMIIWLAGLKGIPAHLYEAARIDGAGPIRRFCNVTLPMLSPYILFNLIIGIIGTMQIFSQAYIMTSGGPNDSTLFYAYYLFNNAFRYFRMGYASAMAWILFILTLVLTLVQMKLASRWVHYETP